MATQRSAPLSVAEKLDALGGLCWIVFRAILTLFTLPFPSSRGPSTKIGRIVLPIFRRIYGRFTIRQLQYILAGKPTYELVDSFAKSIKISSRTIRLSDGTKAQWIGSETAEKVLVYLHAGGYIMYATGEQIRYVWNMKEFLDREELECSVVVLSYDLLPHSKFPRQLTQATLLLNYLLNDCGKRASDITLVGASAGGHLCLSILSHASHPHPHVPKLDISTKFAAMIILSPVTWTNATTPSVLRNEQKDMVPKRLLTEWGAMHIADYGSDSYTEPALAPPEWWSGAKVEGLLLLAGSDETLLDSASEWANQFIVHNRSIFTFIIGENENHVQPVIDVVLHQRGKQTESVESWMRDYLWVTK